MFFLTCTVFVRLPNYPLFTAVDSITILLTSSGCWIFPWHGIMCQACGITCIEKPLHPYLGYWYFLLPCCVVWWAGERKDLQQLRRLLQLVVGVVFCRKQEGQLIRRGDVAWTWVLFFFSFPLFFLLHYLHQDSCVCKCVMHVVCLFQKCCSVVRMTSEVCSRGEFLALVEFYDMIK